jgi:acetyl esterase/lipase
MDIFFPEVEDFFTIVYFHGGGLIEGDKGDTHEFVKHLTKLGFAVATANYSLLTENRFPECVKDAAQAVKYVKDNIKSKGILVMGQSAGAYLTLMLCLNKEYLKEVGIDKSFYKRSPFELSGGEKQKD